MALTIVEADIRGRLARFAAAAVLSAAVLAAPMVAGAQTAVQSSGQGDYPVATAIADALGRDARVGAALAEAEGARYTIDQAKAAYEQVVCAIIRPPRTTYDERHLGPRRFEFLGRTFIREDFEVHNVKDERLVCSRWAAWSSSIALSSRASSTTKCSTS